MSGNPFQIGDKVDGSFEVEGYTSSFIGISRDILKWRESNIAEGEVLSLDEILEQVLKYNHEYYIKHGVIGNSAIPFIRVIYETGMWGVIFEVGQHKDAGTQWYVHGVTKGYG